MVLLFLAAACGRPVTPPAAPGPAPAPAPRLLPFMATAYSIDGHTASGVRVREGMVASDPTVLPLGSRIRIHDAGKYSGEYTVQDTGAKIDGHEIDIYLANDAEAKGFGRRRVKVEILRYGESGAR